MKMRQVSWWCLGCAALLAGLMPLMPLTGQAQVDLPSAAPASALQQAGGAGEPGAALASSWLQGMKWRSIGPANMSGRITAVAVCETDPTLYYVATASGGLLKTSNGGVTFQHQFDRESTVSIGDVCVAPSNPDIVWVGTGENNPRNSASYGDGVYRSTNGGKSWQHLGLRKSFQIGKILIHPSNPDIVYVGAMGRLWGPNPERGLYKTIDGGKTWQHILFIDEKTGVIDMRMHPTDPDTLLVAAFERQRDGYDMNDPAVKWGNGSGLYKTTDGGKKFTRITSGLPACKLGRIGLDWYRKDPNIVVLVADSEKIGMVPKGVEVADAYAGILGEDAPGGARLTKIVDKGPADKAGLQVGDIVLELDKKKVKSYQALITLMRDYKGGDKVDVKIQRGNDVKVLPLVFGNRSESLGTRPLSAYLGGQRENKQDIQGKDGHEYGGVYKSQDGGQSWTRINSLNPRPMYFSQIRIDPSDSNYLYVLGIALHRSKDGGKTFSADGGKSVHADQHALWINPKDGRHMILGTDGGFYVTHDRMTNWDHQNNFALGQFYHVAVDPRPKYKVYGGLQDNGTFGGPGFTTSSTGPVNADWFRVGGGDGFRCVVDPREPDLVYFASQYGNLMRRNFLTGEFASLKPADKKGVKYRWNWNTPFILSPNNHKVYYCGAQYLFKSVERGKNLQVISPELTLTNEGSATAIAESPKNTDVLYVGTDDGALWISRDGGKKWDNLTKKVGLPGPRWVASIEASRYAEGRCYVVFDGHRSDDDEPYVYVTEDFGQSWKALRGNLPWGSTRVLREDLENPNLLFLGTEFGAWCSLDRGKSWNNLNTNLPTVAVHEFALHPTSGDMIAATHGRSFWVLDVSPLRHLNPTTVTKELQLFKPAQAVQWVPQPARGTTNREFVGDNKPMGAAIYYSLPANAQKSTITIRDLQGKTLNQVKGATTPGLHKVVWSLRQGSGGGKGQAATFTPVQAGTYEVVLTVDGQDLTQTVTVIGDPGLPANVAMAANQAEWHEEEGDEDLDFVD